MTINNQPCRTKSRRRGPSFFKIMTGDFNTTIRIPGAFNNLFDAKSTPTKYTLKDLSGIGWKITLEKVNQDFFFTAGWPDFVARNSLEFGDVLVFTYLGDFKFEVIMFDTTTCEKHTLGNQENQCQEEVTLSPAIATIPNPQADQEAVPINSFRSEISGVNDCEHFSPADLGQAYQNYGEEDSSVKILEASQGKTLVALDNETNNCNEDQNKRSNQLIDLQTDDPVTVKRRKKYLENDSGAEKQTLKTPLKSLKLRRSIRQLEHEKKGKTIETLETEGILVLPNNERSADMVETEVIQVDSSDSESEYTRVDKCSRKLVKSTEEVGCHGLGVQYSNGGVSVNQDGLDSAIQKGSSDLTAMFQSENLSCRIVLSRSYLSRGFMHLPIRFVRCLTAKDVDKLNLRLFAANGKIYDMGLSVKIPKAYLCKGWSQFARENNLKVGDVCSFELIKSGKLDLKVSIDYKKSATGATTSA